MRLHEHVIESHMQIKCNHFPGSFYCAKWAANINLLPKTDQSVRMIIYKDEYSLYDRINYKALTDRLACSHRNLRWKEYRYSLQLADIYLL